MPTYKIGGIDVDFPFEAYSCQIVYMEKVIRSLQQGCNALLESPTGTGKTLCLLCATLAWRLSLGSFSTNSGSKEGKSRKFGSKWLNSSQTENVGSNLPTIIYTSRTHSQLQHVIQELKACNYRPKMVVLGSREQMCIHHEVRTLRGRAQNNACHSLCKTRSCLHHTRVSDYLKNNPDLGDEPFDIEDLVNIGRTQGPCPYYLSRELHKAVDILFAPYNYLIDPGNRRSLTGIEWDKTVLIFDEAHNLESICADAASFDLPSGHLTACVSEAKQCIDLAIARRAIEKSEVKLLDPDNFAILKALLLKLEKRIAEVPIESAELGFTRPGPYIYELFADLNIMHETANMLIDTIDNAAFLLEDDSNVNGLPSKVSTTCRLEGIRDLFRIVFRSSDKVHAQSYRVHVQESNPFTADALKGSRSRTLSWWCFNPGIAMEEFVQLGVRSIILTSGTLSPLDSFALELNLRFPVRLENPHVISSDQIWVGVVPTGPSGRTFNSSYRNRDSLEYKQELGNAIVNFSRIVPDGLLVFFPSYYLLDKCLECWKSMNHGSSTDLTTIWERICKHKQPVVEPRQSALFSYAIEDFQTKLNDKATSGAVFFAVCRGKVSEGLDFADSAGRAVIITGIPYAMKNDPKVRLKREFLDEKAKKDVHLKRDFLDEKALPQENKLKVLTGEQWYSQQAVRAVNQAVGRVIRHRHDYGAIIFCDERFAQNNQLCQMSLWLRPHIKCYPKFGDAAFTLTRFFRDKGRLGCTKPTLTESQNTVGSDSMTSLKAVADVGMQGDSGKDAPSVPDISILVHGNCSEIKIHQIQNMGFFSSKTITPVATAAVGNCSKTPLSSILAAARPNGYNQLGEIVPANCSTLIPRGQNHPLNSKKLRTTFSSQNRARVIDDYLDHEIVDLTSDSPLNQERSKADIFTPSKKAEPLNMNLGPAQSSENAGFRGQLCNVEPKPCNSSFTNNSEIFFSEKTIVECQAQNKDLPSDSISGGGDEKTLKASGFLKQVRENLTSAEYTDFVGFMKALKTKTMKLSFVLESVTRLFSAPERIFLLRRFKDYVPMKYLPLYEQHLKVCCAAIEGDESNR